MMEYITTDTHFRHDFIHKYCDRPLDFEEILWKYFKRMGENDILIHLGDICVGKDQEVHDLFISSIKAKTVLVRGNHDTQTTEWYLKNGWDFVCDSFSGTYYGVNVLFSHKPIPWDGFYDINIHGHLHDLSNRENNFPNKLNYLVSLEKDGLKPLSLKRILDPICDVMNKEGNE